MPTKTFPRPGVIGSAEARADKFLPPSRLTILPIVFLGVLVGGLLIAGQAYLLGLLFPALAVTFGLVLINSNPLGYLSLTLWLWLLTPEVRRLMDAQAGWNPTNPVMLTPYLVAGLSAIIVLGQFRRVPRAVIFPFFVLFAGVFLGYVVGLARTGLLPATYGLLDWLIPPLLACYVVVNWRTSPGQVRLLVRLSVVAVIILGTYGVYQFFLLPSWDAYWLTNSPVSGSTGQPVAEQFRVFSTLNSPGPFALVMMVLLLLVGARPNAAKPLAIISGGLGLALSLVRSAWFGTALGTAFLLSSGSLKRRLLNAAFLALVVALLLGTPNPVGALVTHRLATVQSLPDDNSFQARVAFYGDFAWRALADPLGAGIGATGTATKLNTVGGDLGLLGNFDSGLMEIPFVLGWLGTLLYAGGGLVLVRRGLRRNPQASRLISTTRAILIAALTQLLFFNVLKGTIGVMIWLVLGLALSCQLYNEANLRS